MTRSAGRRPRILALLTAVSTLAAACTGVRPGPNPRSASTAPPTASFAVEAGSPAPVVTDAAVATVVPPACIDEVRVEAEIRCPPGTETGPVPTLTPLDPPERNGASRSTAPDRTMRPRALTDADARILAERTAYVCHFARLDAGAEPAGSDAATLLSAAYQRATIYYRANRLEEAAVLFRRIAMAPPAASDTEGLGEISADLYLDALNVMGSQWDPPRRACFERMADDVPRLLTAHCVGRVLARRAEFCQRLSAIGCQILGRQAERMHAEQRFAEAGAQYLSISARAECAGAPGTHLDEVLHNAAIEFDAAASPDEARHARETLVRLFLARGNPLARAAQEQLVTGHDAGTHP